MNNTIFTKSILGWAFFVVIGSFQAASAQSYYVPGTPTPAPQYFGRGYATPVAPFPPVSPSSPVDPQYGDPQYVAPQYVGSQYAEGCVPCTPEPITQCGPTNSGWISASPGTALAPTPDAAADGVTMSAAPSCEPDGWVSAASGQGPYARSQQPEPARIEGARTSNTYGNQFALTDDHPLTRPFQGTYGPVPPAGTTGLARPAPAAQAQLPAPVTPGNSSGMTPVSNPRVGTTSTNPEPVASNPAQNAELASWGGIRPAWLSTPDSSSGTTPSSQPARSAAEVLERYGGVARFDDPVMRR